MKKIITAGAAVIMLFGAAALPAFAKEEDRSTSTSRSTSTVSRPAAVNTACVQAAVAKRESAVSASFDAFSAANKAALAARAAALNTAWGKTDRKDIRNGVNEAQRAYRTALRAASKTYRTANQAAWSQFRTDARSCGKDAGIEEDGGQGSELSL